MYVFVHRPIVLWWPFTWYGSSMLGTSTERSLPKFTHPYLRGYPQFPPVLRDGVTPLEQRSQGLQRLPDDLSLILDAPDDFIRCPGVVLHDGVWIHGLHVKDRGIDGIGGRFGFAGCFLLFPDLRFQHFNLLVLRISRLESLQLLFEGHHLGPGALCFGDVRFHLVSGLQRCPRDGTLQKLFPCICTLRFGPIANTSPCNH